MGGMITQEQLDKRRVAAQYIGNYNDRMNELEEIRRLQQQLTPRQPMREATQSRSRATKTVGQRLAEKAAEKLADGTEKSPALIENT